jgi:hypothetical protein
VEFVLCASSRGQIFSTSDSALSWWLTFFLLCQPGTDGRNGTMFDLQLLDILGSYTFSYTLSQVPQNNVDYYQLLIGIRIGLNIRYH